MENVILMKKDGQVVSINITPAVTRKINEDSTIHLCWEHCKNAYACECKKIADRAKRPIGRYDFITDGYQVYDEAGKLQKFKVTGCSNYELEETKKLTTEEKKHLKYLKDSLRTSYFDAESVDDAYVIQYFQMLRGSLKGAQGKVLSEDLIINKILNRDDAEFLLTEMLNYKEEQAKKGTVANSQGNDRIIERLKREIRKVQQQREAKENLSEEIMQRLIKKGVEENKIIK